MEDKAKLFFYRIMAVLTISLILGACPADSGTSSKSPVDPHAPKLSLSGQVYTQDIDLENINYIALLTANNLVNINKFNNSLNIYDGGMGGKGEIKDGQLNYSIVGVPPLTPINESGSLDSLKEMYPNLEFNSEDVNAAVVALEITGSNEYSGLLKGLLTVNIIPIIPPFPPTDISIIINIKTVNYVYVDKDLDITADAFNDEYTNPALPFPISLTTEKINLNLKKGWNSLYSEITAQSNIPLELIFIIMDQSSQYPDLSDLDLSGLRPKGNLKMFVDDPGNLNWTLIPSQSNDYIEPQYPVFE
jgi:hypothetical protein